MITFERYVSVEGEALDWSKAEKVMATAHTATHNHRFFVTEKGYFGLGNSDTSWRPSVGPHRQQSALRA
jgi:hypothetical protein